MNKMDKQAAIAKLLSFMTSDRREAIVLLSQDIAALSTELSTLPFASNAMVKKRIQESAVVSLKEAIDFSDADYWIDRIVAIINSK